MPLGTAALQWEEKGGKAEENYGNRSCWNDDSASQQKQKTNKKTTPKYSFSTDVTVAEWQSYVLHFFSTHCHFIFDYLQAPPIILRIIKNLGSSRAGQELDDFSAEPTILS